MTLSTTALFVIVILYFLYKKQYRSIFGLLYLLLCILISGYFFIGFENDSFRFSETESMDLKQFLKFLFGWILLYLPYLFYNYKNSDWLRKINYHHLNVPVFYASLLILFKLNKNLIIMMRLFINAVTVKLNGMKIQCTVLNV